MSKSRRFGFISWKLESFQNCKKPTFERDSPANAVGCVCFILVATISLNMLGIFITYVSRGFRSVIEPLEKTANMLSSCVFNSRAVMGFPPGK